MLNDLVAESLECSKICREFREPCVETARHTDLQIKFEM